MITDQYTYKIGKLSFRFPKADCQPNSPRVVMMNEEHIGICPTDDMPTANQIARLISRAVHIHNATRTDSFGGADGCDLNPKKGH